MRVISGSARGRKLKAPPGMSTRPMADKIREASFSMLASLGVAPERVLDLYAGSGSVGIEALSRGAESVDFVEQNRIACDVIRENLRSTGFEARGHTHQVSATGFLGRVREPYDFVIMDPPYADPEIVTTMATLGSSLAIEDGTILLIGHSPRVELPEDVGPLHCLRRRCHGDSCFSIFESMSDERTTRHEETEI
ncbi:MAG TPA: 16S rRNA (guanine(966)-N(2))-methyltransferase RsmD [Nitrolancea sp.]|jgi:16S rRNA (guanine966-N2)-methyltransferase|nr:16S rRNA (guanine(966)-N(2))-methyltransferase RsmD [Nitrolancea sp.]